MDRPLVLPTIGSPASKQAWSAISPHTVDFSLYTASSRLLDTRILIENGTDPVVRHRLLDGRGEGDHAIVDLSLARRDEERGEFRLQVANEPSLSDAAIGEAPLPLWSGFGDASIAHVNLSPEVKHVTLCGDGDAPERATVAAAWRPLEWHDIGVDELLPGSGAEVFAEQWLLLHA